MSYANTHCSYHMPVELWRSHPPSLIRVNGVLRGLNEFAAAFNCPLGSHMNPNPDDEKRCPIWWSNLQPMKLCVTFEFKQNFEWVNYEISHIFHWYLILLNHLKLYWICWFEIYSAKILFVLTTTNSKKFIFQKRLFLKFRLKKLMKWWKLVFFCTEAILSFLFIEFLTLKFK